MQSGLTLPLELTRVDGEVALSRPQEPKPPYPYRVEEVTFENTKAGLTLAGTLTLPEKGDHYPVVVLISGSGPQNRDEEMLGHKPFLVLADYLTRQGIGVLRFDDGEWDSQPGISRRQPRLISPMTWRQPSAF